MNESEGDSVVDYFFSYKKRKEKENKTVDYNVLIDDLIDKLSDRISKKITDELRKESEVKTVKIPEKRSFEQILEEEVSKFDSIEEVQYLGKYLVEYWKKLHLK